ncbi:MAG: hypothetical protein JOZ10_08425 [Acidobacteria bacterium]|nr:hypothetical protein [Acidobacteriota bacterium]MBV9145897.1 hypothetical protein [Acidobacteriota bacterium]MBV9437644.1 hypothetical protein [Acidobacteriota bacterium]
MKSISGIVAGLLVCGFAFAGDQSQSKADHRPVVFVQPSDSWKIEDSVGGSGNVILGSGRGGKEPQTAKIYQLLQHRQECTGIAPNMLQQKADYVMLVEHGGGKGNRWAVSDKDGDVVGSGESFVLGTSVADACRAVMKDWSAKTSQK